VVGVSADSMDIAPGIGERDGEAFSDRPKAASVTIQASICSSLYLILQGVPLLEVASLLLTVVGSDHFSLAMGMASRNVCAGVLPKHQRP